MSGVLKPKSLNQPKASINISMEVGRHSDITNEPSENKVLKAWTLIRNRIKVMRGVDHDAHRAFSEL
jgi:hypothetical protein